jgi:hypothetical protein
MKSVVTALAVAAALAACSSNSSDSASPAASTSASATPSVPVGPTPAPAPTVTAVAGVKAPVTPTQLASVFGSALSGPRAATNGQPTLLYGEVTDPKHLVVSISIYTPALLSQRGTTPAEFYSQGEEPTAEHVTGIGQKAYIVQDQITVLTNKNNVLIVAANQQVREEQLKDAARQAAAKI